ncbi:MAG: hypothetical protein ACYCZR_02650 [Burkholderiales bacterium]
MTDQTHNRRSQDSEISELRREVAELRQSVSDLVEAWRAARGFLALIKWAAGLGSAVAIIWSSIHGGMPK